MTVTGRTLAENVADVDDYQPGQNIIRPLENPIKADSHLVILRGNLAPEGAVAKITGHEGERFEGNARRVPWRRGSHGINHERVNSARGRSSCAL